jgi:hypothetical protein
MAKKDSKEAAMESDALAVTGQEEPSTGLATTGQNTGLDVSKLSDKEQVEALERLLDCSAAEIEAIATGRLPFWPAIAGQIAVGTIVGQREVPTRFGIARLYTMTLSKPALAQTLDGEIFELPIGENISILERAVLKELTMREGQKLAIVNAGKKLGSSGFSYWDYKIVGVQRTSAQIQAAAQMAMARMQARMPVPALPSAKG